MSDVKCQSGQLVIVALILLMFILMIVGVLFARTAQFLRFGGNQLRQEQAGNLADAGADYVIWKLNVPPVGSYSPSTGEETVTIQESGKTLGEVRVKYLPGSDPAFKKIQSVGCVPDCTNPRNRQTINVDSSPDASSNWQFIEGTYKFTPNP